MAGVQGLPDRTMKMAMARAQNRERILNQMKASLAGPNDPQDLDALIQDMASSSAVAAASTASSAVAASTASAISKPPPAETETMAISEVEPEDLDPAEKKNPNPVLRSRPPPTVIPGFEKTNTPWSPEDVDFLNAALAGSQTIYDMAIHLHRTESAVRMRLMKMGINILNTTGDVVSVDQVAKHIRVDPAEFRRYMYDFVKKNVGNEGQISTIRKLLDKRYDRPSSTVVLEHPPPIINVNIDAGLLNFTADIRSRMDNLEKILLQVQQSLAELTKIAKSPSTQSHTDNIDEAGILEVLKSLGDDSDAEVQSDAESDGKSDDKSDKSGKSDNENDESEKEESDEEDDEDDEDEQEESDEDDESEKEESEKEDESEKEESEEDDEESEKSEKEESDTEDKKTSSKKANTTSAKAASKKK